MDIVYICRKGENEELRYSIRSVVKNLPESRIWVVGYKPGWYSGDFIPVADKSDKFNNIRNALKVVCNTPEISSDFVFMHDDIYIIEPIEELKPMYSGTLKQKLKSLSTGRRHSTYYRKITDVARHLGEQGFEEPLNYEVHVPMPMNKEKLITIVSDRYLERSMYGNLFVTDAEEIERDVKNYDNMGKQFAYSYDYQSGGLPFLSSHDRSFITMKPFLDEQFPAQSKYEYPQ